MRKFSRLNFGPKILSKSETTDEPPRNIPAQQLYYDRSRHSLSASMLGWSWMSSSTGISPVARLPRGVEIPSKIRDFAKNGPFCEQKCHLDEEHGRPGGFNCDILAQQLESCRLSTTLLLGHVVLQGLSSKYWLGGRKFSKNREKWAFLKTKLL